jgi:DNA polymerase elongation subunit (family B)
MEPDNLNKEIESIESKIKLNSFFNDVYYENPVHFYNQSLSELITKTAQENLRRITAKLKID